MKMRLIGHVVFSPALMDPFFAKRKVAQKKTHTRTYRMNSVKSDGIVTGFPDNYLSRAGQK